MQNPLRDLSRPKALLVAGVSAGVLTVASAAAAINVGLLSSGADEPFTPEPVASTGAPETTTTVAVPPTEIVYQDVYEHVPAPTTPPAPQPAATVAPAGQDDDHDDDQLGEDLQGDDDQLGEEDHDELEADDHEDEDHEDADHEDEDHADEDHEDDGVELDD